jgi:hypothetical protein
MRRPARFFFAIGLVWLCGCAANAPWFHHADDKPFYESTYFRVPAPKGSGWKAVEERPSDVLDRYGYYFEPELFDEFVPPRIGFERYTAQNLWPGPKHAPYFVEFYSTFTRSGPAGNGPRELAEAENRKTLAHANAHTDTLVEPWWSLERTAVAVIGGRQHYEFVMTNGESGKYRRYRLQYIWFSKDMRVACVANVRADADTLPLEARRVLESVEPLDGELSLDTLPMRRAAQELYELTLKRFDGRPLAVYPSDIGNDLLETIRADARREKTHLFLGAIQFLTEDLGPVLADPGCGRVKLGLWDFYCVTGKGSIVHSLFDGYTLSDETLDKFRAELEVDPKSFWANYYVAGLYVRHDEFERAESQARLLTEYYPESALAWYTLGIALKRAGKTYAARIAFSTASQNYRGDFGDRSPEALAYKNIIQAQLRSLD